MRQKNDFYRTHERLTVGMLEHPRFHSLLSEMDNRLWFEPCAGDLAIAEAVYKQTGVRMLTNDIDKTRDADYHLDASQTLVWQKALPDWTITNPPYREAPTILRHAIDYSKCGVIALLRLSFAEPCRNREWLRHYPPSFLLVAGDPRPSFRLNDAGKHQTDSVTTAWFLWQKGKNPCMDFLTNDGQKWGTPAPADSMVKLEF